MEQKAERPVDEIDITRVDSVVLRRLIEEVRNEDASGERLHSYDRVYNRHNRS